MSSWKERKLKRIEHYNNFVYKVKMVMCIACNGSGYYDSLDRRGNNIVCSSCDGLGKVKGVKNV